MSDSKPVCGEAELWLDTVIHEGGNYFFTQATVDLARFFPINRWSPQLSLCVILTFDDMKHVTVTDMQKETVFWSVFMFYVHVTWPPRLSQKDWRVHSGGGQVSQEVKKKEKDCWKKSWNYWDTHAKQERYRFV